MEPATLPGRPSLIFLPDGSSESFTHSSLWPTYSNRLSFLLIRKDIGDAQGAGGSTDWSPGLRWLSVERG